MEYELPYDELPNELLCPSCGRACPPSERFCESCAMPLVQPECSELPVRERRVSERRRKVRKIDPQYTDGELVKVASARGAAQAEFIAGLLLEEGIPSIIDPAAGGPYAPIMGVRTVLVPESAAQAAREALAWTAP
jgi:hypothetical protein